MTIIRDLRLKDVKLLIKGIVYSNSFVFDLKFIPMKIYSYLSTMILFSILAWNTSVVAQDDLYFDPATDENFEAVEEDKYGDEQASDKYVDEAFDDEDYYYDDDFYYSRRIRRYNRPNNSSFGYYNPWFTNNAYLDPYYYNTANNGHGGLMYFGYGSNYNSYSPYGNPYAYSNNPYNNPYSYNPYYNSYIDPCYNPYYSSYYSPYGYYGGNPYNGNNGGYNPNADYPTASNSNYGPRGAGGGTVDAFGNGKLNSVKQGRDNVVKEQELQYFEASGRTAVKGNVAKEPVTFDANEGSTKTGRATKTEDNTRSNSGKAEIRTDEPSRSTRPSRDTREPRSTTPPRSSTPRSTTPPRSSTPRSTPKSSTPRSSGSSGSGRSSSRDKSSSGKSSSRSGGKNPR